ncbi:hypothetical protein [Algiphilus sp.]|uniref:hypothetical protein n=1 Tax=Algiphilus sp. TaxID=1872431 RepID=UPI003C619B21
MLCCASLLLVVAWLQHVLRRAPSASQATAPSSRRIAAAFLLWGAGLAALAYLAITTVLVATGIAVHVDGSVVCLAGAGGDILPVPAATVADAWLVRNLALVAAALVASLAAAGLLLTAPPGPIAAGRPRLVIAGAGAAWIVVTTLDHQLAGLFALPAHPLAADLLQHGIGVVALVGAMRPERRGTLQRTGVHSAGPRS